MSFGSFSFIQFAVSLVSVWLVLLAINGCDIAKKHTLVQCEPQLNDNYCLVSLRFFFNDQLKSILAGSIRHLAYAVFVHYLLIDLVAINKIVLIVCFCVRVCLLVRLFAFFVFYSKQTQHAELRGPLMLFWYNYISVIIYIKFMLIYALWVIELYRCDGAPRFAPLFFSFGCRSLFFYFLHISFVFVH